MTVDAFEMAMIHGVFRREFASAPVLIREVAGGDTRRSKVVAGHLGNLISVLHHHHCAEDEVLWPLLAARVPRSESDIARMPVEHDDIARVLSAVLECKQVWAATAEPERAEDLVAAVGELSACVDAHLDDEERNIVPLINTHVTPAEWQKLLARGAEFLTPNNVAFALAFAGFVLQGATPDERRRFLAGVPIAPRMLFRLFGGRAFSSYRNRIYGAS